MYLYDIPTVGYCEKPLEGLIKRPWYAISNLTYVFLGIYLLLKKDDQVAKRFGALALAIGLISLNYDVTYAYWSQLLDLFMMLIFASTLIYSSSIGAFDSRRTKLTLLGVLIISMALIISLGGYVGNVVFGLLLLIYLVMEYLNFRKGVHQKYVYLISALTTFIIGVLFWYADTSAIYCLQFGLFNGRAVFHYLGTISVYLLYRFYSPQTDKGI